MATIAGSIAEKAYMIKEGSAYGTAKGGVMCTGPVRAQQWSLPGNDIVLYKRTRTTWDPAYTPKVKTVTVKFIVNSSTLTSALLSGEVSWRIRRAGNELPRVGRFELRKPLFRSEPLRRWRHGR